MYRYTYFISNITSKEENRKRQTPQYEGGKYSNYGEISSLSSVKELRK